jgi:hypothetical protein
VWWETSEGEQGRDLADIESPGSKIIEASASGERSVEIGQDALVVVSTFSYPGSSNSELLRNIQS